MNNNTRITYIVLACVAVVAVIIISIIGLNIGVKYSEAKQVQFYIEEQFEISEIKDIVKDVVGRREYIIQKVELYGEVVSITIKDISDDEIEELKNKINEKYKSGSDEDVSVIVQNVAGTKIKDIILPYVLPIAISLIIIIIYAGVRYKKIDITEILLKLIGFNALAQVLYLSILAIVRIPVNTITMPTAISIYVLITLIIFNSFEKKQTVKVEEENKKAKKK